MLQHPWIKAHDRVPSLHLADSIEEMKRFNARQKFRAAALACIASHRLQRLLNRPHEDHDYLEGIMTGAYFTPIELERLRMEFVAASRGTSALSLEAFKVSQYSCTIRVVRGRQGVDSRCNREKAQAARL